MTDKGFVPDAGVYNVRVSEVADKVFDSCLDSKKVSLDEYRALDNIAEVLLCSTGRSNHRWVAGHSQWMVGEGLNVSGKLQYRGIVNSVGFFSEQKRGFLEIGLEGTFMEPVKGKVLLNSMGIVAESANGYLGYRINFLFIMILVESANVSRVVDKMLYSHSISMVQLLDIWTTDREDCYYLGSLKIPLINVAISAYIDAHQWYCDSNGTYKIAYSTDLQFMDSVREVGYGNISRHILIEVEGPDGCIPYHLQMGFVGFLAGYFNAGRVGIWFVVNNLPYALVMEFCFMPLRLNMVPHQFDNNGQMAEIRQYSDVAMRLAGISCLENWFETVNSCWDLNLEVFDSITWCKTCNLLVMLMMSTEVSVNSSMVGDSTKGKMHVKNLVDHGSCRGS